VVIERRATGRSAGDAVYVTARNSNLPKYLKKGTTIGPVYMTGLEERILGE